MKQRLAHFAALSIMAMLVVSPAALADEGGSNNELGLALGLLIIAASAIVMNLTSRHYSRKRKANERKNRARAKSKRKR